MEVLKNPLNPNPREKANFLSALTFFWTIKIFKKGYKKVLELEDLFKPLEVDRSEALGDRLERNWDAQVNGPGRPSLLKAICKTFWREYTYMGFLQIMNEFVVRLGQPILLGKLLFYFRKDSDMSKEEALYYAGAMIGLTVLNVLSLNQYIFSAFHYGMKLRVACCSLIYRKSLKLSRTALGETAIGKIVNLLSNDVNRFDIVTIFIHSMWSAPALAFIVGYILWLEAGWAGLIGMVIVFIVVPIQTYTGKLSSRFRLRTALRTDERVRFMDEVISGVQVIKMYAWEKPFSKLIAVTRRMELKIVKKNAYVRGLYMTFNLFTTRMAIFITMMSMIMFGQQLTAAKIFVIAAYYNIIAHTMSQMFVRGVAEIAEVLVAIKRLQTFMTYEERDLDRKESRDKFLNEFGVADKTEKENLLKEDELPGNVAVSIKNAFARWVPLTKEINEIPPLNGNGSKSNDWNTPTLNNLNIDFKKGLLIGVIGPVGAGKSSLLQAILRELPLESGSINLNGKVSYACQEPWVFAGSARQNILFGEDMIRSRYESVIKDCALVKDFQQLSQGDSSIIGERGASLSGGQRARISLARAVYRKADIYLLDDPLSAVDAHVGRHLFDECIGKKGRLGKQRATRILVTHQVHFLKESDWIVVLKDGKVEMQGSPQDLANSGIDFAALLKADEDKTIISSDSDNVSVKGRRSRSNSTNKSFSSQHSINSTIDDGDADSIHEEKEKETEMGQGMEQSSKGQVKGSVFWRYLSAGAHPIILVILLLLFLLTQIAASFADLWVAYWIRQEELRDFYTTQNNTIELNSTDITISPSNLEALYNLLSTETCMYIHGGLMLALFTFAITRSLSFCTMCVKASQKLHDGMFLSLISTTMRFFDTNPSGRILNRFSKDIGSVDEQLPKVILDAAQIILNMCGAIIVTTSVNPIFLVPVCLIAIIFVYVRKVFLKTSKNIKRLDGITRSPVFSHIGASLNGLSTIRAFDAQEILIKEFDAHQDIHSAAWYMFITTSTAFGFALDLMCLVFIFIVVFYFVLFDSNVLGDQVGLAVTQSLALTGLMQWGIRQSAEVANYLMSVERVLEYDDLDKEAEPEKPIEMNKTWPEEGKVEFRKVTYRYYDGADPVLNEIEFSIKPNEKIGIVGRTGAGKSSLIGALFRLAKIEGSILIDGIDTGSISLETLRSKVSIIPQDPVLFSGTLRRNLDPFEEYPDASIWQALEAVELKEIANGPLGLQSAVQTGGCNYSVGQRQLLCLARAVLRDNKVLILDEATANVDPKTDSFIQETIRRRFAECTVLTVAHRLHTIMDSDRVLVMDAGRAVEFEAPHLLLQKSTGIFKEMVNATGTEEAHNLARTAKNSFESKIKLS